jgi:hypothetical protein
MSTTMSSGAGQAAGAARILELIHLRLISEAIYVVAALGIADELGGSPKTIEELARAAGADAPSLGRIIRALQEYDLFCERPDGRIALTPTGELLRSDVDGSLHAAALFFGGERSARFLGRFQRCVQEGKSVADLLFGGNWTEWIQCDPDQTQLFNAMMTSYSALQTAGVLEAYDFSHSATIVDVGGGHGRILCQILKRSPETRGVLFDMPHASEGGRRAVESEGLAGRCEVVSGDFFVSVPAGADTYLLSRVIHDWDDERSIRLLKVVRNAIAPRGRLILLETLLRPDTGSRYPVLSDLNMLIRTGGRERTEEEYRTLYRAAGFELTRTVTTQSPFGTALIEGVPAES